ncbi:MAG TPA: hypothetical protein VLC09_08870, partial [Polyangiaceae bacterium]|nr:hypothetical protein [Polyangiaceae bacterium]
PTHATFALGPREASADLLALGFVALGPRAVRLDLLERMLRERDGEPKDMARRVAALAGAPKAEAARLLRALSRFGSSERPDSSTASR